MTIAEIKGTHDGKDLILTFDVSDTPLQASVEMKLQFDGDIAEFVINVMYQDDVAIFSISPFSLSGIGVCFAGCGMTFIVGPVIQCAKSNKSLTKFTECVKGKGLSITAMTAECILSCLVGAVAGGHSTP